MARKTHGFQTFIIIIIIILFSSHVSRKGERPIGFQMFINIIINLSWNLESGGWGVGLGNWHSARNAVQQTLYQEIQGVLSSHYFIIWI